MSTLRLFGLVFAAIAVATSAAWGAQKTYRNDEIGVEIAYDDKEWDAKVLASYPYFVCIAADCVSASCLVITSLDPDFAAWPETMDKASLEALDEVFLEYEKTNGGSDSKILEPTSLVTLGGRDTLVNVVGAKFDSFGTLSPKYMFRDAGDTRIVTCEGDKDSVEASKARIETLIGAIKFTTR